MKRCGKMFGLAAILATTSLFVLPLPARAGEEEPREDRRAELRKLQEQINHLRKMADLESRRNEMEFRQMNERLERIERALARLAPRPPAERGASEFDPDAPPPAGTLRLSNRLPVRAYVTVNGRRYSVPPFAGRSIVGVPAGALTYEVTANGYYNRATTMSNISAGETLTVTINPPRVPVVVFE
jgi:hypothetical protein